VIQFIKYAEKWTNICVNVGICLGNNQDNFQLHRFTTSENIANRTHPNNFSDSHCIRVCMLLLL